MKKVAIVSLFLGILFLFTRLYHLSLLPIFVDESIHIYWAKLIATTNQHYFISLVDEEPPFFIWMIVGFLKILPNTWYIIAGRLPSVVGGAFTLTGVGTLTCLLTKNKLASLVSCFLFILSPFALFYDRLASYDSLLAGFSLWTIIFALLSAQKKKIHYALLWGIFLGLTCLTKANGFIFFFLSGFVFLYSTTFSKKYLKKNFIFLGIAFGIGELLNLSLLVSKGYLNYLHIGLTRYTGSPALFLQNLFHFLHWTISYNTILLFFAGIFGLILLLYKKKKIGIIFVTLWVLPIMLFSFVSSSPYPRYILFCNIYLLIVTAYFLFWIYQTNKIIGLAFFLLALFFIFPFDYDVLQNIPAAPLPQIDREQYITGHTSGYGLSDVFHFLDQQKKPLQIITLGTISSYPYAFNLYYWDNPKVTIDAIWPVTKSTYQEIRKTKNTFVILKVNSDGTHKNFLQELGLKEVFRSKKPAGIYPIIVAKTKN